MHTAKTCQVQIPQKAVLFLFENILIQFQSWHGLQRLRVYHSVTDTMFPGKVAVNR